MDRIVVRRNCVQLVSLFAVMMLVPLVALRSAQASYTWTQLTGTSPLCSSSCSNLPTAWAPTLPTAPVTGTTVNAIALAPAYFSSDLFVFVLNTTTSGSNHEVAKYNITTNSSTTAFANQASGYYTYGLTTDPFSTTSGTPWAVNDSNVLGECEASSAGCWTQPYATGVWANATSVAANNAESTSGYLLATDSASSCTPSGYPDGQCIECYIPSGTWATGSWSSTTYGASQVTPDKDPSNYVAYALGSSGNVWSVVPTVSATGCSISSSNLTKIGDTECAGGTVTIVQIAAKDWVFALDSSGEVWINPIGTKCWDHVTSANQPFTASSIATDNDTSSGEVVWATDSSGGIWYAH
jgi:hypothetical protein